MSDPARRPLSLFVALLPWLVLALGVLASAIGWELTHESQLRRLETDFRLRTDRATQDIRKRLLAYEQVLRGGSALFDATGSISRAQWRVYVNRLNIGETIPGVQSIGFVRLVSDQDKATHIKAMRAEGLVDYDIRPAGIRSSYVPIVYLEPFSEQPPSAFGYDMSAESVRRVALERARDRGTATISGRVRLIHDADVSVQTGFVMYMPVYRGGVLPESVQARRSALIGYVYAPFRVSNLMSGALDVQADGIDLELFDGVSAGHEALLFDLDGIPRFLNNAAPTALSFLTTLDLNGRSWTLRYEALPAFFNARADRKPVLVLAGGALISLLLFGLTWFASRTRSSALALAAKMSATLHENERHFAAVFHSAMDAIISIDNQQVIQHFNPAAEKIFRCSAAHAIGSPLTQFMPLRFRQSHGQHVKQFGTTGVSDRQMGKALDLFGLRADGEEFPLEASISHTTQGGNIFYTVILRDITARKQAETALRKSEQRFRNLIEVCPAAIYIHQDEVITFVNKAALILFGAAEPEQLIGKSIYTLFHADVLSSVRKVMKSLLTDVAETPVLERKIVRLDGEIRFVEVAVSVFDDEGKRACQAIMRDITDRYLSRAELERSHVELRLLSVALETAQEEERRRIAMELHDDLGQHLTVLKMDMSSVKLKLKADPADPIAFAGLHEDIERMDGLLNHTVQSVRRISADLRPLLLDDLGLATALEALVNQISRSSAIHCTLRFEPDRLSINQEMATPIYRIAQEALNNVAKHSRATEAELKIHCDASGNLVLEVCDNGIGFSTESRRKAASFGLIGMRERIHGLGGVMLIESEPGAGTKIRAVIPNPGKAGAP